MPLSGVLPAPPVHAPSNWGDANAVTAYCKQFMTIHYQAPPAGSKPWNECVHWGFNLPTSTGGIGNSIGHIGGGGLAVLGVVILIAWLARRSRRAAPARAR